MSADRTGRITTALLQLGCRHLVGLVLTFCSVGLVFKCLSAEEYGHVVLAQGVWFFFFTIAPMGLDAYVVRCREELSDVHVGSIYSVTLLLGGALFVLWQIGALAAYRHDPASNSLAVIQWVGVSYLIRIAGIVPTAALEARLRFGPSGIAEVAGQVLYVSLLAALFNAGAGVRAVVFAQMGSACLSTALVVARAGIRPAVPSAATWKLRQALRFGLNAQASVWVWQSKDFIAPVVITWAAGSQFLGVLGMANQVLQRLLFFRPIVWRVSVSAVSRLKDDKERVSQAIQYGANALGLVLGVVLLGVWVLLWFLEARSGARWSGVSAVFPAMAVGVYANSMFTIGCSALFSAGRIRDLTVFHAGYVLTFLAVLTLMRFQPSVPVYYLAECASCAAYVYLYRAITSHFGTLEVHYPVVVGAILLLGMVGGTMRHGAAVVLASAAAAVAILALPKSKRLVGSLACEVWGTIRPRGACQ